MTEWFTNENAGLRQFWHPVARLTDLEGSGPHSVRLLGDDYALAKLGGGWALFPAACPHRLAPLTAGTIVDDTLQCAYHGWCFAGDGACVSIPALGAKATIPPSAHVATAAQVAEKFGLVWVSLDEPLTGLPDIAEWEDSRFGKAIIPTQTWNASAAQMTDNFLDVAHFPFTHLGTIGDPDDVEVAEFSVDRKEWSFESVHHHSSKVLADATSGEREAFETFDRTMTFACTAPHHVKLHIDYGTDGELVLLFFHQPVDRDTTTLYSMALAENIADGRMRPEDHIAFQGEVGREDRELLEQLLVKAVPLTAGVEVHTRADKSTVELRRILRDIDSLSK